MRRPWLPYLDQPYEAMVAKQTATRDNQSASASQPESTRVNQ
jgi:hypothetical protein